MTRWEAWFVVSVKAMIEDVGGHQTRFPEGDGMLRSHTRDPSGLRRRVAEFDLLPAFNLGPKQVGTTDEVVVQVEERVETEIRAFPSVADSIGSTFCSVPEFSHLQVLP